MRSVTRTLAVAAAVVGTGAAKAQLVLLAADPENDRVLKFDPQTGEFGGFIGGGPLDEPSGIADTKGGRGRIYVSSRGTNAVLTYDVASGAFIDEFIVSGRDGPGDIEVDRSGRVYILSTNTGRVHVQEAGAVRELVAPLAPASSMAMAAFDSIFVAYPSLNEVRRYDITSGAFLNSIGPVIAARGLDVGPDGVVYVGEDAPGPFTLDSVRMFRPDGTALGTFVRLLRGNTARDVLAGTDERLYVSLGPRVDQYELDPPEHRLAIVRDGVQGLGALGWVDSRRCYADCDQSTGVGMLDVFDFLCFQNAYARAEHYACDCDPGGFRSCDVFDFLCFQNRYAAGCP